MNIKLTLQVLAWWFVGYSSVVNCGEVVSYLCTGHLMMWVISVIKYYNTINIIILTQWGWHTFKKEVPIGLFKNNINI
jgi:hypothetical protein